jgi:ribosomal protein S18 acetylase RimI-like enzyme
MSEPRFRAATADDAPAVAALHTDSWQRHYRGIMTDQFLDQQAAGFLAGHATQYLAAPGPADRMILAELDGALAGFAHTLLDRDPTWGALLDNLHVSQDVKRGGIGTRLMALAARFVRDKRPGSGLYLWVYEDNTAARAFYAARGGECVERRPVSDPPEAPGMFAGHPLALRMAWPDPATLLA